MSAGMSKYAEALALVMGWTAELRRRNGRVDRERLADAYVAGHVLRTEFLATKEAERALTALRAELAIAETVKLWKQVTSGEPATVGGVPLDDGEEKPRLAALMAEPAPWEGWSGPTPASVDEGPGDVADRVTADLDGAAALLAELMADESAVPEPVASRSSGNILRALAGGAEALRLLAGRPRVTVTDRSELNAELLREIQEYRAALADAEDRAASYRAELGNREPWEVEHAELIHQRDLLGQDVERLEDQLDTAVRNARDLEKRAENL